MIVRVFVRWTKQRSAHIPSKLGACRIDVDCSSLRRYRFGSSQISHREIRDRMLYLLSFSTHDHLNS